MSPIKEHPELVDDFFGRPWVKAFNGNDAAERLSNRKLTREQKARARTSIRTLYDTHFQLVDGGLPVATSTFHGAVKRLAVFDRYVEPTLEMIESIVEMSAPSAPSLGIGDATPAHTYFRRRDVSRKMPLSEALGAAPERLVLLGGAGLGKSAALRVMVHDLLGEETRFPVLAKRLGQRLPLLLPFAYLSGYFAEKESPSIDEAVKSWLQVLGAKDEVLVLLESMVADDRLMLLIDGLDEWQNREVAVATMTALVTYAHTRRLPLIATARPLGFEQISDLGPEWVRAKLMPLSSSQQRFFMDYWFRHFYESLPQLDAQALQQAIERDEEDFTRELADDSDLSELSSVPLLLNVLIYLRLSNRALPNSRLTALEELVKALMEEQPKRRAQSAMQIADRSAARSRHVRLGLEYLSYCIHREPNSLVLSNDRATELLNDYFQTQRGLPSSEAEEWSARVLELGKGDFGVLVAPQQDHVGMLHRIFQEYLAAKYISHLSLDRIRHYCTEVGRKAPWNEVTCTLLQLLERPDDVDGLLELLRAPVSDILDQPSQQILLARLAAAETNASRSKLYELSMEVFGWIECGRWMPLRLALVREITAGISSEQIGPLVAARAKRWFPGRLRWLFDIPVGASTLPTEETADDLWIALHNCDSSYEYRRIIEALVRIKCQRTTLESDFMGILQEGAESGLMAAALYGLCIGWPENPTIPDLLGAASTSPAKELRLVAWLMRFRRGERTNDVRNGLFHFCQEGQWLWPWEEDVLDALVNAWPREPQFKQSALDRIGAIGYPSTWAPKPALEYILRAYPGDDEVAAMIAKELSRTEDGHSNFSIQDARDWLLAGFKQHRLIVPAAEAWLNDAKNVMHNPLEVAVIAQLGGTAKCRQALLTWLRQGNSMPAWIISTLEEMVGSDNPEFQAALCDYISDERRLSDSVRWLHLVIRDQKQLSDVLRKIMLGRDINDSQYALGRLIEIESRNAPDLWAVVKDRLQNDPDGHYWRLGHRFFLKTWPEQPLLRSLVKATVFGENIDRQLIYEIFGKDIEIRALLDSALRVLHEDLRIEFIRAIEPLVRRNFAAAVEIASAFKNEPNGEARTIAARAYVKHCIQHSRSVAELTGSLRADLIGLFSGWEERRQAAVAGLLELGKADIIAAQQEFEHPIRLSSHAGAGHNWEFVSSVVENWESLARAMPDIWERFSHSPTIAAELAKCGKGAQVMGEAKLYEEAVRGGKQLDTDTVRALIALHGRSTLLRELFATRLQHFRPGQPQSIMVIEGAAYHAMGAYLAEHFYGDAFLLPVLRGIAATGIIIRDVGLVALCRGWPDAPEITAASQHLTEMLDRGAEPFSAWLFATKADDQLMASYIVRYPSKLRASYFDDARQGLAAVRSRLESDRLCRDATFAQLKGITDLFTMIGVSRLLAPAMRNDRAFREWISEQLRFTQETHHVLAPLAFDALTNRARPVKHALLEAVLTHQS